MLLNLILGDPHLQQILQHSLYRRIAQINPRRVRSTPVRLRWRARTLRIDLHSPRRDDALRGLSIRRTVPMTAKQAPKPTLAASTSTTRTPHRSRLPRTAKPTLRRPMRKRLAPRILMRILLPLIHLLLKLPRLLLVREAEPKTALLTLKTVEEGAVLEVLERVVDLLVPDDAAAGRADIDELEPEGVAHEVVGEDGGALQAGVLPLRAVGEGDVEFGDGDGVDLVGGFGDGALDRLLLVVAQDRGHRD